MDEDLEAIRERKRKRLEEQLATRARGEPVAADPATLDELFDAHRHVLVDLWAPWCGPCKQMEPVLEAVAKRFRGQLVVAKVDVDEHPEVSQRFAVQGIPTLLLVDDGEVVDRVVGAVPQARLIQRLETFVQG